MKAIVTTTPTTVTLTCDDPLLLALYAAVITSSLEGAVDVMKEGPEPRQFI